MKNRYRYVLFLHIATFFIAILLSMRVFSVPSYAVDLVVINNNDNGEGSLRTVIDSASDGDTISFVDGIKHIQLISPIIISKNLHIKGSINSNRVPNVTIISPKNNPIFNCEAQLGLYGLAIETTNEQRTNMLHASVYSRNEKIVVEDCKFIGANQYNCSAVFAGLGDVTIKRSSFENYNAQYGGAVMCVNGPITVSDSSFLKNTAYQGGAIHCVLNEVSVHNSIFSNNTAAQGGSIWCGLGKMSIANSQFIDGIAYTEGGALFGVTNDVNTNNSSFVGNHASYGIAIATLYSGDIISTNTTFYGNTSTNTSDYNNGVIECNGKTVLVQTTLVNNQAIGIISKSTDDPLKNIYAYNSIIVGNIDQDGNPKQSNKSIFGGKNIIESIPIKGANSYKNIFGFTKLENGHIAPICVMSRIGTAPKLTSSSFLAANLAPDQISEILHNTQTDARGNARIPPYIFGSIEKVTVPVYKDFVITIILWDITVLLVILLLVYAARAGMSEL